MDVPTVWFETVKLIAQLVGAVFVAKMTVNWALSRYKAEKLWERKLSAYSDLVTSLSEIRSTLVRWIMQIENEKDVDEASKKRRHERSQAARQRLDETVAVAQLILSKEAGNALTKFHIEFKSGEFLGDLVETIHRDIKVVERGLDWVITEGRADLFKS